MRQTTRILVLTACISATRSEAVTIDWADSVVSSIFVSLPANALGAPDNQFAGWGNNPGIATYDYTGSALTYDSSGLATLLGITPGALGTANFIAFEVNGSAGLGFEGSVWSFDDGSSVFTYTWVEGSSAGGPVVAAGSLSFAAYAAFFGLTPLTITGDIAFLLFNAPVDVNAPDFEVTLASSQNGRDGGTPDPDAMGAFVTPRAAVPEPSSWVLMGLGLAGAAALARPRR
jgi:hypothetical protein